MDANQERLVESECPDSGHGPDAVPAWAEPLGPRTSDLGPRPSDLGPRTSAVEAAGGLGYLSFQE